MNRLHYRHLIEEVPALLVLAIGGSVLAGCASSAAAHTASASPAHSPVPAASTTTAPRTFASRHYGYTEELPAGWGSPVQATQQWGGTGAPGDQDSTVDLFQGPGGVEAWAVAAPAKESLAAYARATMRAAHAGHACPASPQTDQRITIGGAPARLLDMQCPLHSGFLVEIAVTIRQGTAFVFSSQNPVGTASADQPADRAAFRKFLAGITFTR